MKTFPCIAAPVKKPSADWYARTPGCAVLWGMFSRPTGGRVLVGWEEWPGPGAALHCDSAEVAEEVFAASVGLVWLGTSVTAPVKVGFSFPVVPAHVDDEGKTVPERKLGIPTIAGGGVAGELVDGKVELS